MDFEKTKKQYEDEVLRLKQILDDTRQEYSVNFSELKRQEEELTNRFNEKCTTISIGIERLRGAYTALCDMESGKEPTLVVNGMMKDVEKVQPIEEIIEDEEIRPSNEIPEEIKDKAHKILEEAKEKGLVTSYEEFAESELGKETAVENIEDVVNKEKLAELHQSEEVVLSDDELEALNELTEEVKNEESTQNNEVKNEVVKSNVNPDDVPDYLKEEYGLK